MRVTVVGWRSVGWQVIFVAMETSSSGRAVDRVGKRGHLMVERLLATRANLCSDSYVIVKLKPLGTAMIVTMTGGAVLLLRGVCSLAVAARSFCLVLLRDAWPSGRCLLGAFPKHSVGDNLQTCA